jgi:hypothetical protein
MIYIAADAGLFDHDRGDWFTSVQPWISGIDWDATLELILEWTVPAKKLLVPATPKDIT